MRHLAGIFTTGRILGTNAPACRKGPGHGGTIIVLESCNWRIQGWLKVPPIFRRRSHLEKAIAARLRTPATIKTRPLSNIPINQQVRRNVLPRVQVPGTVEDIAISV